MAPNSDVIGIARIPNDQINIQPKERCKIPIALPDEQGNKCIKYFDIEDILVLCFQMIFPSGKISKIPGQTLRQKASIIFNSHEIY